MQTPLILFGALFLSWSVSAQIESLETKLAKSDRDTSRVNTLTKLAALHFNSAPEKARTYTTKALDLADSIHYTHGLAEAYLMEAAIYRLEGQTGKDLEALVNALHLFESVNDSLGVART